MAGQRILRSLVDLFVSMYLSYKLSINCLVMISRPQEGHWTGMRKDSQLWRSCLQRNAGLLSFFLCNRCMYTSN